MKRLKNRIAMCVAVSGLLATAGGCGNTENAAPSTREADKTTGAAKTEPTPKAEKSASLTAEQAKTVAMRLANDKAFTLYHCQPFRDGQPARFVAGQWVWVDLRGFGHGDIQATVEFAAVGSTSSVDLKLLDSQNQSRLPY
jgi:hypothetical protein